MRPSILRRSRPGFVLATMLAIAVAVGFPVYYQCAPLLSAAFVGACYGVLGIWFLISLVGFWSRFPPRFHVGDFVIVMRGPHAGATGKVSAQSIKSRRSVVVALQNGTGAVTFESHEIQKL